MPSRRQQSVIAVFAALCSAVLLCACPRFEDVPHPIHADTANMGGGARNGDERTQPGEPPRSLHGEPTSKRVPRRCARDESSRGEPREAAHDEALSDGLVAFSSFDTEGVANLRPTVPLEAEGVRFERGIARLVPESNSDPRVILDHRLDNFGTSNFSITFWFRTTSQSRLFDLAGDRRAGSHGNFISVRMTGRHESLPAGTVSVELDQDEYGTNYAMARSTSRGLNDGAWHHLAIVRAGRRLELRVDGRLESVAYAEQPTKILNANEFQLGRSYRGFEPVALEFAGLRVYDRALGDSEAFRTYAVDCRRLL